MSEVIKIPANGELSAEDLKRVAAAAKSCKIIAFPTDTVYGLGSTGLIKAATRRIYQIKDRSTLKPLPVFVKNAEAAKRWVQWTPEAEKLAAKWWPGPVTLVLKPTDEGRILTFAEFNSVAIRVPAHPVMLKLLEASDIPWVSTSANRSGQPAAKDGQTVVDAFTGTVDFILDGGTVMGTESTIVDAAQTPVRILREGAIKRDEIMAAVQ
jgi:L-threonylcarbamoyladenylate synthase